MRVVSEVSAVDWMFGTVTSSVPDGCHYCNSMVALELDGDEWRALVESRSDGPGWELLRALLERPAWRRDALCIERPDAWDDFFPGRGDLDWTLRGCNYCGVR